MNLKEALEAIQSISSLETKTFKAKKFGIICDNSGGVYQKDIAVLAKKIGKNTELGVALFTTNNYDAQLLAAKICRPKEITETQMDAWIKHFNTWEICDSFCMQLFKFHPMAIKKALAWSKLEKEYEKRAGFVLMATYGFADKNADNKIFEQFFPILIAHASDDRTYVKKAINWALRQIGKRNIDLQKKAIETANELLKQDSKSAQWIAKDALRELENDKVNILDYPRAIYRKSTS